MEALYIHLAEFYSLSKREKIISHINVEKEVEKNIKVFHKNQINIVQMSQNNVSECVKYIVESDKKSIKLGGSEFTFYLANRHLSRFFGNNSANEYFLK